MTIKELIKQLQEYPEDYTVEVIEIGWEYTTNYYVSGVTESPTKEECVAICI